MKPIPVNAARKIADEYDYDQVIVIARKVGVGGGEHCTTYGRDKANCDVAARCGDFLKYKVMQWPRSAPEAGGPAPEPFSDWTPLGFILHRCEILLRDAHFEPVEGCDGTHSPEEQERDRDQLLEDIEAFELPSRPATSGAREAALEEAAKVCDALAVDALARSEATDDFKLSLALSERMDAYENVATRIRSLASAGPTPEDR